MEQLLAKPATATRRPYMVDEADIPVGTISLGKYSVRFARSEQEIDAVLRMRFDVFNLELGEGLESSYVDQRDRDEFDLYCHHLVVMDDSVGGVVGTYRLQTHEMAVRGAGFYSAGEFDLSGFPDRVLANSVEVGRACVSRPHRNTRVLFLLWRGLAMFMVHAKKRYLFGCSSLTSQDPAEGNWLLQHCDAKGYLHPEFCVHPLPHLACIPIGSSDVGLKEVQIPRLFRIYLDNGAKVCGPPAIDREFKTIDFLTLLDIEGMDPKKTAMYFEGLSTP